MFNHGRFSETKFSSRLSDTVCINDRSTLSAINDLIITFEEYAAFANGAYIDHVPKNHKRVVDPQTLVAFMVARTNTHYALSDDVIIREVGDVSDDVLGMLLSTINSGAYSIMKHIEQTGLCNEDKSHNWLLNEYKPFVRLVIKESDGQYPF